MIGKVDLHLGAPISIISNNSSNMLVSEQLCFFTDAFDDDQTWWVLSSWLVVACVEVLLNSLPRSSQGILTESMGKGVIKKR